MYIIYLDPITTATTAYALLSRNVVLTGLACGGKEGLTIAGSDDLAQLTPEWKKYSARVRKCGAKCWVQLAGGIPTTRVLLGKLLRFLRDSGADGLEIDLEDLVVAPERLALFVSEIRTVLGWGFLIAVSPHLTQVAAATSSRQEEAAWSWPGVAVHAKCVGLDRLADFRTDSKNLFLIMVGDEVACQSGAGLPPCSGIGVFDPDRPDRYQSWIELFLANRAIPTSSYRTECYIDVVGLEKKEEEEDSNVHQEHQPHDDLPEERLEPDEKQQQEEEEEQQEDKGCSCPPLGVVRLVLAGMWARVLHCLYRDQHKHLF